MFKTLRLYSRQYCIFMLSWHYLYSFGYYISYLVFILDYRLDEARRTYFGSFLEQGGAGKEALPRRDVDVTKSRRGGQLFRKSTIHHVATSSRRDVTTSRRLLKILHLIIKCEEARESRGLEGVRPETRNWRPANTDWRILLDFCIGFYLFTWLFLD